MQLDLGVVGVAALGAGARRTSARPTAAAPTSRWRSSVDAAAGRAGRASSAASARSSPRARPTSPGGHAARSPAAARRAASRVGAAVAAQQLVAEAHDRAVQPSRALEHVHLAAADHGHRARARPRAPRRRSGARPRPRGSRSARGSRGGAARAARGPRRTRSAASVEQHHRQAARRARRSRCPCVREGLPYESGARARDPSPMTRPRPVLPATLRLGAVDLTVADLDRAVALVPARARPARPPPRGRDRRARRRRRDRGRPARGPAGAPAGRHAGLYHYALLYPRARSSPAPPLRLAATRTPIEGASDHRTHEAIYLPDADGNGIELAADRPREQWPRGPRLRTAAPRRWTSTRCWPRSPASEPRAAGRPRACAWATCTCTSATSTRALAFYRDVLGFEVQAEPRHAPRSSPPAATTTTSASTSGAAAASAAAPPHTVGLRHWTVELAQDDRTRCAPASTTPRTSPAASSSATRGAPPSPSCRSLRGWRLPGDASGCGSTSSARTSCG